MTQEKSSQSTKQSEPKTEVSTSAPEKKRNFYFPRLGKTVKAVNQEEAVELVTKKKGVKSNG